MLVTLVVVEFSLFWVLILFFKLESNYMPTVRIQ